LRPFASAPRPWRKHWTWLPKATRWLTTPCRHCGSLEAGIRQGLRSLADPLQAVRRILADANRHQRHLERCDEAVLQRKIAMTLGYFDQVIQTLEGQTAYQHNIGDMGSAGLTPSIQTDMATAAG